jgi:hypothetical protein
MKPRTLAILVTLGVISLGGGWYFGTATTPSEQVEVGAGKLMFPGLAEKLPQARKIEIVHQGKPMVIEKQGQASGAPWGLDDRDGYRVQESKLRGMLTALTELRLVEPRTSDPTQFNRLGVESASGKQSNSALLRVLNADGKPIAEVIVGHRKVRTQGDVPDEVYVRRPGQNQAWLAEGALQADYDPQLWLDRDIMNIDHTRINSVTVTHGGQTLTFARDGDKLTLQEPKDHPKIDDYRLEDVSRAFELLTFQDVRSDKDADQTKLLGDQVGQSVFRTSDGLAITTVVFETPKPNSKDKKDKDVWARFAASGSDKTKDEAARIQSRVAGWTYQLGSWKEKSLIPTMDDLKAAQDNTAARDKEPAPAAKPQ